MSTPAPGNGRFPGPDTASTDAAVTPAAGAGSVVALNHARGTPAGMHPATDIRKLVLAGFVTVLLVFGLFGTWAALAPLAGAIIGHGEVKVDLNRKTVQHLEGGIISEIRVRDGDHVQAGQTLVVLVDERINASVDVLQGHLDAELAKAARLEAQRDNLDEIRFPAELTAREDDPVIAELLQTERTFFQTRRTALLEEVKLLGEQIEETRKEIDALQIQQRANHNAASLLREEVEANQSLEVQQYIQRTQLLALQRAQEEYNARVGEIQANMSRARQRISEMELRIVQIRDEYVQRAVEDLTGVYATGVYARIFDLRQSLRPNQDAKRRQHIVAPISGTIVDLKVFTIGGVVRPGEPLLDIVPDENPLIVEARINVDDIDDVHVGQAADIRFSAYKRRSTPLVAGSISYVSADRLIDEVTGQAYYTTHVEVDQSSLKDAGNIELHPGMPAEVFIRTGERTALDYLLAPITQTMRRSFRES